MYCEKRGHDEIILITESTTTGPLSQYLKNFRNPRLSICRSWLNQILSGLQYLHSQNITHGHLCCQNILMNSNTGEIKIGNLVLSRLGEILAGHSRPVNPMYDIKCFGLIALEIGLSKYFPSEKLKKIMRCLYRFQGSIAEKARKLISRINDQQYRELIENCLESGHGSITAEKLLRSAFFTNPTTESATARKDKKIAVKICLDSQNDEYRENIDFLYDTEKDTPEGIITEMKKDLKLPEKILKIIKDRIENEGIAFLCGYETKKT